MIIFNMIYYYKYINRILKSSVSKRKRNFKSMDIGYLSEQHLVIYKYPFFQISRKYF